MIEIKLEEFEYPFLFVVRECMFMSAAKDTFKKNILFNNLSLNFICRLRKQLLLALFTLTNTFQS